MGKVGVRAGWKIVVFRQSPQSRDLRDEQDLQDGVCEGVGLGSY